MSEIVHFVHHGASLITPKVAEDLLRELPLLKVEFAQINAPKFPHLVNQLEFLADAMEEDWATAFNRHYGYGNLQAVERDWTEWVLAGSPPPERADGSMLAANDAGQPVTAEPAVQHSRSNPESQVMTPDAEVRGQSPPPLEPLAAIDRPVRTQPRRRLSAPEPNVTAMPEFLGADWSSDGPADAHAQIPPTPPARTRAADLGGHSTFGSSTAFAATRQAADAGFPTQRTGDRATWPDERTEGLFSP